MEGLGVEGGKGERGQGCCGLINQHVLPVMVEPTHHPVGSQGPLDVARHHVGWVMPVVRNAGQPGVDGQQNQEELQRRPQQPSPPPCQPSLQVKLGVGGEGGDTNVIEQKFLNVFVLHKTKVNESKDLHSDFRLDWTGIQSSCDRSSINYLLWGHLKGSKEPVRGHLTSKNEDKSFKSIILNFAKFFRQKSASPRI